MCSLEEIKNKLRSCLAKLYTDDAILFTRNNGRGLCERCLVFRLALYLQQSFSEYFVDCDFNSAVVNGQTVGCKPITNPDGSSTGRYVDIIVHRRTFDRNNDFICLEVKKWNSGRRTAEKDRNNLRVLTSEYGYQYGFLLTLAKRVEQTKWTIFQHGEVFEDSVLVFRNRPNITNDRDSCMSE